jgi:hypothetical protein
MSLLWSHRSKGTTMKIHDAVRLAKRNPPLLACGKMVGYASPNHPTPLRPDYNFYSIVKQLTDMHLHSRSVISPELCNIFGAPQGRAQGRPGARCTRDLVCKHAHKKTHTSIQVQRKQSGLPCAMALRLIPCSPRRDLACLSPSPPGSVSFPGI